MHSRPATPDDVELLFDVRTSVLENHPSRAELASIGVTPRPVAEALRLTGRARAGGGAGGAGSARGPRGRPPHRRSAGGGGGDAAHDGPRLGGRGGGQGDRVL